MHDIWNPWHGCVKKAKAVIIVTCIFSTGREMRTVAVFTRMKNNFDYPLQKDRGGGYRVTSGEQLRVCMTSDFFLAEADGLAEDGGEHTRPLRVRSAGRSGSHTR